MNNRIYSCSTAKRITQTLMCPDLIQEDTIQNCSQSTTCWPRILSVKKKKWRRKESVVQLRTSTCTSCAVATSRVTALTFQSEACAVRTRRAGDITRRTGSP